MVSYMVISHAFGHSKRYSRILRKYPEKILAEVIELRQEIIIRANQRLQKYPYHNQSITFSDSAYNLAHYLAMRQFDLRYLQDRLSHVSLTSLGRAEG